jgi:hypothetical protein
MVFDYYDRVTTDMGGAAVNACQRPARPAAHVVPAKTDAQLWAMQGATIMNGLDDYLAGPRSPTSPTRNSSWGSRVRPG